MNSNTSASPAHRNASAPSRFWEMGIFSLGIYLGLGALGLGISAPAQQQPALPVIIPYYDAKAYAWAWTGAAWRLLPRNEARVLHKTGGGGQQLAGTLTIDGDYEVPAISGANVILLFRKETDFKTYDGLPAGESGIEVVKLDVQPGPRKGQLIRTAQLQRQGAAAATFGDKREPITVQKIKNAGGVFHLVRATAPLSAGRYALYLPDRAFEFEVK